MGPMLFRTHTSPMQIRTMEQRKPPVRVVVPGRCYRFEATDATHESVFFQYEGLAVDEKLTMADLKGVLYSFARQLFGGERKVRFRPDYFPFTEPSAEIAFDCFVCDGAGVTNSGRCATCAGAGWIEAAGCGMVHPDALRRVGYDPAEHQGFAFGGGSRCCSPARPTSGCSTRTTCAIWSPCERTRSGFAATSETTSLERVSPKARLS
jgi:phenylalanyl-tRNA synthetase alpha chain